VDISAAALVPALTTLAAALIAGGIAHSNLIISKEAKTSEFRQAWIDALRAELAIFFASTRTMARAAQEARAYHAQEDSKLREVNAKFHISGEKITEIRHAVADTFYKIKLRLNPQEPDHVQLLNQLEALAAIQNAYLANADADIESIFQVAQDAADQAARVLKGEWKRVKVGEPVYRRALQSSSSLLLAMVVILVGLIAVIFFGDGPAKPNTSAKPVASAAAPLAPTKPVPASK
jgi:hypothetical protein